MKEKFAKLIDLKSIITILITSCLIYGFVANKINDEQFMTIATMIFTFYFAKKDKGDDNMATIDNRSVEEIKEDLKTEEIVEEKKEGEE